VAASAASRARCVGVYKEVQRRVAAGEKLLAISGAMGLARSTVRRYVYVEHFPERAARVPPPSILDPFLGHLKAQLAEGCENAMTLGRELQALGSAVLLNKVHRWVSQRRTRPAKKHDVPVALGRCPRQLGADTRSSAPVALASAACLAAGPSPGRAGGANAANTALTSASRVK
jgi:hypothetical protein